MKIIERVVKSAGAPGDNDLWLKEEGDNLSLKAHHNGSWKTVAGGGSGGGTTGRIAVYGEFKPNEESGRIEFIPGDGQPTLSEAAEAFESGIPVTLVMDVGEIGRVSSNVLCHTSGNIGECLIVFAADDHAYWISNESPIPGSEPEA